ncbi:hypothetical protein R530_20640 [Salmonella enterica subsp. arizonae serovar 50:r:z]|nr:hypothetical protein R530_20640 [Salmonella enterica subsp. arizonae serovar 50:r:z]
MTSTVYTSIIVLINIRQQKYLTPVVLLPLKYSLHPSRGTNSFMKYHDIINAAIVLPRIPTFTLYACTK